MWSPVCELGKTNKAEEKSLTSEEIFKVIDNTIEKLNKNFEQCMSNDDKDNARKYLVYADGIRMLKDNMEYELHSK